MQRLATVYRNEFSTKDDVISKFNAPADALDGAEVIYADYTYEDYSGNAMVIYEKDGKLYEVNGSHCSCYGLEGQWWPEETSWEAIAMREDGELKELAESHLQAKN